MIDILQIDEVYKRYGYIVKNRGNIRIYEFKQGRYFGVDFFVNKETEELEKIKKEYSNQGYAILIRKYCSVSEVEEELFKSFFQIDNFKTAIEFRYSNFVNNQLIAMPDSAIYEYIKSPYSYMEYDTDGLPVFSESQNGESIIDNVTSLINSTKGPLFVIIEAAAGFGKTCSAYELLKNIYTADNLLPLYIELSRNREARIFKHILQNEINNQFQNTVTYEVVIHEIKRGKIPVIIDGFDELLSKDISKADTQLRDVESMLATIVNLLENEAKIIITSRKTAIFSGEEFYEWMQKSANTYKVARFSLAEPKISNWLNESQIGILHNASFPIANVANPVLLSYIRNIPIEELKDLSSNSKNIIDKYFDFILNRERIRQNFNFDNETQLRILKKLVRFMTEFDIKSEKKSFIKEIIKDYNTNIFEIYRKNYPSIPKPTHEELADTLSNHALLDRKQNDEIGIINEFILGILIGRNLLEGKYQEHYPLNYYEILNQDFAFLSIQSFKIQVPDRKELLWKIYTENKFKYNVEFDFYRDIYLINRTKGEYSSGLIEGNTFEDIKFHIDTKFIDFIFADCKFINCSFDLNSFKNSGFVNSKFYNCIWIPEFNNCQNTTNIYFAGCNSNNNFMDCIYEEIENITIEETINVEELILKYFVKPEGRTNQMKRLSIIRDELSEYGDKLIDKTINSLEKRKFIVLNGGNCFIQREGIIYFNNKYHY